MTYEVTGRKRKINFGATGVDEVLQNVAMILTTPKGTVPLRRDWFIDGSVLDMPQEAAKARLATEIFTAIRAHEPRARIVGDIRFVETPEEAMYGKIIPAVTIEVVT
jgi:hypothetical protein